MTVRWFSSRSGMDTMRNRLLGALIVTALLTGGWTAGTPEVPLPVPQPGPGPTVPPKPSDPIPVPPTTPPSLGQRGEIRSPALHRIAERDEFPSETLSGVLVELNLDQRTGRVTTDMGRAVSFSIPNPDLFRNLSIGERVTLKLDSSHRVVGVLEQTAPELPPPG